MKTSSWDREYTNPVLMTGSGAAQPSVLKLLRLLKKQYDFRVEDKRILDFACGTGRLAVDLAQRGATVHGFDISGIAIDQARALAHEHDLKIDLKQFEWNARASIDERDAYFDCVIMNMALHLFDAVGRTHALEEINRVLRPRGFVIIRTLAVEGDSNAKQLLKQFPSATDSGSYRMPDMNHDEHPFSRAELMELLSETGKWTQLHVQKVTGHPHFNGKVYKRQYWEVIAQKS
jgi:2-polyprenyl-3-methyl-5-hydroxy-6-metoxy-1,4-benzoquinol methylase